MNKELVWAQTADFQFQADVSYSFGQQLLFHLTSKETVPVELATLYFQAPEFNSTYIGLEDGIEVAANGFRVVHEVDLSTIRLAPFTTVTYWWVLKTAVGDEIRLPEQNFVYADNQFEWQNLAQGSTTVYWTGNDAALGQIALDVVTEARPTLQMLVTMPAEMPLAIYIYPTSADLRAALRLTGRDWVGAHAAPELGVLLVTAVNIRTATTDLGQNLPHEMMHFYLYQMMPDNYEQLPVWLNEGLATLVELTPRPVYETVLTTAVADQNTIPFAQLCTSLPTDDEQTLLAYAQSLSLMQYIQAEYGTQKLRELIAIYGDGADCQTGPARALSTSLTDLNQDWLRHLQPRSELAQFWDENGLWFLLLFVGLAMTSLLIIRNPL